MKTLVWSFALLLILFLTVSPASAQGIAGALDRQAQQDAELAKLGFGSKPPAPEVKSPTPKPPPYVKVLDIERGTMYEEYDQGRHGRYDSKGDPVYGNGGGGPDGLGPGQGTGHQGGFTSPTSGTLPGGGGVVCPMPTP